MNRKSKSTLFPPPDDKDASKVMADSIVEVAEIFKNFTSIQLSYGT